MNYYSQNFLKIILCDINVVIFLQIYSGFVECFTKINPQRLKICEDARLENDYLNICDGSRNHCEAKGKEICWADGGCYGITYPYKDMNNWLNSYKGVAVCKNQEITSDPEQQGWNIFMRCNAPPGKTKRMIDKGHV